MRKPGLADPENAELHLAESPSRNQTFSCTFDGPFSAFCPTPPKGSVKESRFEKDNQSFTSTPLKQSLLPLASHSSCFRAADRSDEDRGLSAGPASVAGDTSSRSVAGGEMSSTSESSEPPAGFAGGVPAACGEGDLGCKEGCELNLNFELI